MLEVVIAAGLVLAGLIHLLPLSGVLGATRLQALYGLDCSEPNLLILMQHRAVLFGLLGALMLLSVVFHAWRWPALILGTLSAASFMLIAVKVGHYNSQLRRVVMADGLAVAGLIVAAVGMLLAR